MDLAHRMTVGAELCTKRRELVWDERGWVFTGWHGCFFPRPSYGEGGDLAVAALNVAGFSAALASFFGACAHECRAKIFVTIVQGRELIGLGYNTRSINFRQRRSYQLGHSPRPRHLQQKAGHPSPPPGGHTKSPSFRRLARGEAIAASCDTRRAWHRSVA